MSDLPRPVIEPISFPTAKVVPKAWGSETWIVNLPQYCLKLLRFKAGAAFSTHYHWSKVESWTAHEGQLRLDYLDLATAAPLTRILNPGDVVHIPAGNPHKLTAITDALVLEASTTHRDEDSYRIAAGDSQKAAPTVVPVHRTGKLSHYGMWGYGADINPYPEDIGRRVKVAKGAHDPRGSWIVGEPEGVIIKVTPVTCAWAIVVRTDSGREIYANPSDCTFID